MQQFTTHYRDRARLFLHDDQNKWLFTIYVTVKTFIYAWSQMLIYSAALIFQIPWPTAYLWRIHTLVSRLSKIIASDRYNIITAQNLEAKAKWYLGRLERKGDHSEQALELRSAIGLLTGKSSDFIDSQLAIFELQEFRAQLEGARAHNMRILEPHFHILIGIGSTVHLDAYVKAGILNLRPPTRSVILHEPWLRKYAVNPCLLDYWKQYIDIIEDPDKLRLLRPLKRDLAFNVCGPMRCGDQVIPWAHSAVAFVQQKWDDQMRKPLLRLTDEHRMRGASILNSAGVPQDAWFVTMHVREGKFGDHRFKESFRDADVTTYIEAIKAVTERGGWVIRMGDASMTPLPSMPKMIDYATSSFKSDWMDIFLIASARFMIGTSSGPSTVSRAFGVPIAMTNYLQASTLYFGKYDLFLPRLMRHLAGGELLSFDQQMSLPYSAGFSDGMFRNIQRVEVIPNTFNEIRELVEEMLDRCDGRLIYSPRDNELQKQFKHITARNQTLIGLQNTALQCRIGRKFLGDHQALLN